MAVTFRDVTLSEVGESGQVEVKVAKPLVLQILDEQENLLLRFKEDELSAPITNLSIELYKDSETARFGQKSYVIRDETGGSTGSSSTSILLQFARESDVIKFAEAIRKFKQGNSDSVFAQRTDDSSAVQYFQFYGYLSQQQNMMQDYIRTSTYQKAILSNTNDFKDKIVLDVGAGSGILSFFAIQSGARKVYAVEASSMAKHAEQLVYSNKLTGKITVISGKIEEISLPEMVDIIISEPMGYMLFNERMLETYLHAKKWLKPGGRMFPTRGDLHVAPFSDAALYMEQLNKANFWYQENFHGVDLSSLRSAAVEEYFKQPVVDTFDVRICTAKSVRYSVDFEKANEGDLHKMVIPVSFTILQTGEIHGLAFWFDVAFLGSQHNVWLSTAPTQPLTHWYQVRCLIDTPIFLHRGQILSGNVTLASNKRQSYDVIVDLINPSNGSKVTNVLDLKNPYFRYTGQPPQPPPGTYETSPSEAYWSSMDTVNTPVNPSNSSNNVIATGAVLNGSSTLATSDGHHSYGDANAVSSIIGANNTASANSTGMNHYQALTTGPSNTTHHPLNTQIIGIVPTVHQSSTSSLYPGGAITTTLPSSAVVNSTNHATGNSSAAASNNRSASPLQLGRSGTPVSFTPNPGNNSFQMTGHHVIPPCSIGGGISPSLFTSTLHSTGQNTAGSIGQGVTVLNSLPYSNNLMIGDYASTSTVISGHHHPQPGQQMLHKQ